MKINKLFDKYHIAAFIVILLASLLRFYLILLGWPSLDSDEGTMGLMALHIAYQGARPLVFYGQDYLAPIDAYLAAFFFPPRGPLGPDSPLKRPASLWLVSDTDLFTYQFAL
uniref:Glycosyltransferase RgtA/B/C/D-like domain-containing protein n=1 Tax=Thermogemmatispora argillosa TaxID=2045280 RepID=A0A455T281_9CHLR|nr:hypothetical protein KTA_15210 [Thermogemmatispora argillosa]